MPDTNANAVRITIRRNGPLRIEGPFLLIDSNGQELPVDRAKPWISFCRCGQSANKPFCDGAHKHCGFQGAEAHILAAEAAAASAAADQPAPPVPQRSAPGAAEEPPKNAAPA